MLLRAEVRAAFDDVYRLTPGRATREQLVAKMRALIYELGGGEGAAGAADESVAGEGAAGELKTVEAATKRLRELLRACRVLVVVDDAWTRDHFAAFVGAIESGGGGGSSSNAASVAVASGSSLLFTTRNLAAFRRAAEPAAMRMLAETTWSRLGHCAGVDTAELAPGPARSFLAAAAGIAPTHAAGIDFGRVFAAVGTLPLPLFIVGACARRQLEPLGRPDREAERNVVGAIAGALETGVGAEKKAIPLISRNNAVPRPLQAQSLRTLFVCAPHRLVALPHQVRLAPRRLVALRRQQSANGLRLIGDDGADLGAADALAARRVAADL